MMSLKKHKKLHGERHHNAENNIVNQKFGTQHNNALLPVLDFLNMIVPVQGQVKEEFDCKLSSQKFSKSQILPNPQRRVSVSPSVGSFFSK